MKSYDIAVIPGKSGPEKCVLPFYSAEEHTALENRKGPFTVVEILREVFNEDFKAAAENYIATYPGDIRKALGKDGLDDIRLVRIGEPCVESSIDDCSYYTVVDLFFNAVIDGLNCLSVERKLFQVTLNMRYVIDMGGRRCSVPLISVTNGTGSTTRSRGSLPANDYLLPVMRASDYDDTAFRILELYYREALDDAVAVDGYELAHRMRIVTRKVRLRPGTNKRGIIYFSEKTVLIIGWDGVPKEITVRPLTMLINADLCPTPEIENSTVVHECVHVYLDSRFFLLQSLAGGEHDACTGRSVNATRYLRPNSPIEWMELQAEKLPAYILMEANNTRRVIEELYDDSNWDKSPQNVMRVVEKLAARFGVSKSMAKYRMIEVGFPEAEGVYCFADNRRIPDHGCSDNWKNETTYTISIGDAAMLISESAAFRSTLMSGFYTYLEGHYCLDKSKYVWKDRYGNRRLTDYARTHIEECCIAFRVSGRYANVEYIEECAAKKTPTANKLLPRYCFKSEPDSEEFDKESSIFIKDVQVWDELLKSLPNSFPDAVGALLAAKEMTMEQLALEIGVSRSAVYKWLDQERVSLRHVVAICIALDLRADFCEALVGLSGSTFRNTLEHILLRGFLYHTDAITVALANAIMDKRGLPKLTNGKE